MQDSSFTPAQLVLTILASGLVTGLGAIVINRLGDWWSGKTRADISKSKAEAVEIHATTVKIQAEAEATYAERLLEALRRVTELVEINSILQGKLDEVERQRDNAQWDLKIANDEAEKSKIRHELREHFIKQLEAANELGVRLRDLQPEQIAAINERKKTG